MELALVLTPLCVAVVELICLYTVTKRADVGPQIAEYMMSPIFLEISELDCLVTVRTEEWRVSAEFPRCLGGGGIDAVG